MPVLSQFYGIIIRMYFLQSEHNPPHIHAIYNEDVAAIDFMTGEVIRMNVIKELWHGNIVPQDDSRNNSPEMKELMEYMARHHDDLLKSMTDEQKEIFEKFDDCWSEYMSLAEAAIFEYAFRLGAQMMLEITK